MNNLAMWSKEITRIGWHWFLVNLFYNSLSINDLIFHSGRSKTTVKRHMNKFVSEGYAIWDSTHTLITPTDKARNEHIHRARKDQEYA